MMEALLHSYNQASLVALQPFLKAAGISTEDASEVLDSGCSDENDIEEDPEEQEMREAPSAFESPK